MRPAIQAEPLRWLFTPLLGQEPDGMDRQRAEHQSPLDGGSQLRQSRRLQQPQPPDEPTPPFRLSLAPQPATQHAKTLRQIPVLQRSSEVRRARLSLQ